MRVRQSLARVDIHVHRKVTFARTFVLVKSLLPLQLEESSPASLCIEVLNSLVSANGHTQTNKFALSTEAMRRGHAHGRGTVLASKGRP